MSSRKEITVRQITESEQRQQALSVLQTVYKQEKAWIKDPQTFLPAEDLNNEKVAWFGAEIDGKMIGVARILFELPVELYKAYGFKLLIPGLDVEKFVQNNRIAEVGRYAVLPEYRNQFMVAVSLMRALSKAALQRAFTHLITDVFEADPNTPHGFHSRILGFKEVATHEVGELNFVSRRITMLLDLAEAKARMQKRKGWIFRYLLEGLDGLDNLETSTTENNLAAAR